MRLYDWPRFAEPIGWILAVGLWALYLVDCLWGIW